MFATTTFGFELKRPWTACCAPLMILGSCGAHATGLEAFDPTFSSVSQYAYPIVVNRDSVVGAVAFSRHDDVILNASAAQKTTADVAGRVRLAQAPPEAPAPAASPAPTPPPPDAEPPYKRKPSPPGAKVYFVYPTNGLTVPPKVHIKFGLIGMGVAPAGFEKANTGHHHLLIDTPLPPLDEPVPNDFHHLHFPIGQTEADVTLPLGTHRLQLLFADSNHVPHDPAIFSDPIEVTVTPDGRKVKVARKHHHHRR